MFLFRKENARKIAQRYWDEHKEYVKKLENRNAVLEYQNKALLNELKTLKVLYEDEKKDQRDNCWENLFPL